MQARDLFEILIREQSDMLLCFIRASVRDPGAVDDIFQETLITAWKKLDSYDRTRPLGPWLRGIAGKLILVERRKAPRHVALCDEELLDHLNARCHSLERQAGDTLDEKLAGLKSCIDELPEAFHSAVQLTYQQGLDTKSLAERLEVPLETAKKRLQRARARLLDCLTRKLSASGT